MIEQVVTLILKNGNAQGILECQIDEWYGISYKIPRNKIREAKDLDYINNTGVYILFGEEAETSKKIAYIGETEKIYERIKKHNIETDFWNECIVFMSENNSLNKAHIKYIENELYNIAKEANRFEIRNDTVPTRSSLGSADEIRAKKFVEKIKIITPLIGYKLFDRVITEEQSTNDNLLYLTINGINYAKGMMTDEGFVILKGSKLRENISGSLSKSLVNYCERERNSTDIIDGIFVDDHLCSTPSMAAVLILGRNSDGYNEWKNKDNVSLRKITNRM